MQTLNDIHSRLNATEVAEVAHPASEGEVVAIMERALRDHLHICAFGGRHAMGGQQFCAGGVAVDTSKLTGVPQLDIERGLLTIGAGARWPEIIAATRGADACSPVRWAIRQKQTGADAMSFGGSLGANVHGRGLVMGPIVEDVERFRMVTAGAEVLECSREKNAELFALAIGGYGMFGIITEATLRLTPRRKMRRLVDIIDLDDAINAVYRRAAQGCVYGDFQYAIEPGDDSFLRRGVMACYEPVAESTPVDSSETDLPRESWLRLLELAHTDKRRAFQVYSEHYLASHGRVYWSDTMQLSTYIPTYAEFLADRRGAASAEESLMITELNVPPERLMDFIRAARLVLRSSGVEDIYGTIRAIRKDTSTYLPWAREDYACVIFNLRTVHTDAGIAQTQRAARGLIDAAIDLGGTYYLTYHRWATAAQALRAYPRFPEWMERKRALDPTGVLRSTWFDHHRELLSGMGKRGAA